MTRSRSFPQLFLSTLIVAAAIRVISAGQSPAPAESSPVAPIDLRAKFASERRPVVTGAAVTASLEAESHDAWVPAVNGERARGADNQVYELVAPAVVVILSPESSGTGFALGPDGLIVTNDHVVEPSIRHDVSKGASYVETHRGTLGRDGLISLDKNPVRAYFLKTDPVKDLALLKLDSVPKDGSYRHLRLSAKPGRPGDWAAVVGHPSSGMLWTYRTGEVSAIGRSPDDLVDFLLPALAAANASADPSPVPTSVESTKILLSSVGCNPGDSGSPLVNRNGEVIAVTFAVPSDPSRKEFTYHVHGDELRAFVADAPDKPAYAVPDPWRFGAMAMLADIDRDGRAETLAAGQEEIDVMMFDLDGNSPAELLESDEGFERLIAERKWDFEFAVGFDPPLAWYDSDDDGTVDIVLLRDPTIPDKGRSTSRFVRGATGKWTYEPGVEVPMWSATNFATGKFTLQTGRIAHVLRSMN